MATPPPPTLCYALAACSNTPAGSLTQSSAQICSDSAGSSQYFALDGTSSCRWWNQCTVASSSTDTLYKKNFEFFQTTCPPPPYETCEANKICNGNAGTANTTFSTMDDCATFCAGAFPTTTYDYAAVSNFVCTCYTSEECTSLVETADNPITVALQLYDPTATCPAPPTVCI